jgi:uncharacterized protein
MAKHSTPGMEQAIETSDLKKLERYLAQGADPNLPFENGILPLAVAASAGRVGALKLLLAAGADSRLKGALGFTALHYATTVATAEALVEAGADVNAVDNYGQAALSSNVSNKRVALVKWLLSHGAGVERGCLHTACLESNPEIVAALLEAGADPNERTEHELTPLMYVSASKRAPDVIKLLLDAGADPNAQMVDGRFPLHFAATDGTAEMAEALLDGGARIEMDKGSGETALAAAVYEGNHKTAAVLLRAGANPAARISADHGDPAREGKTALDLARASKSTKMRKLFGV